MFRKAFAAIAALSLAAQPALAQGQDRRAENKPYHGPINRQTLVPLGIIVALTAIVVALTFHTRHSDRPHSP